MSQDFSVLVSLYNGEREDFLEEALSSLTYQSLRASEVIIVLDGFVRESLIQIIDSFKPYINIKIVPLDQNYGLAKALKVGLLHCRFDLVARMDTDDICEPNRFFEQVDFLIKNPDIDILGSNAKVIDDESLLTGDLSVPQYDERIKEIIWTCPIIHPSVMFRKGKVISVGNYDEKLPKRQEDYELWIRASEQGLNFHNLQECLIKYRICREANKKNNFSVGFNRLLIGWHSAWNSNYGLLAILAICYPMFRALIPSRLFRITGRIFRRFDPRNKL
ncbi:glycosyltransferase [Vibrio sp. 10N.261.55.A10]|uniref:glycosyltransferase n=1 Tax=Vibrio sp. 10N.261.55.A10 TaxID=3229687 RepID=UPI00354B2479